MAEAIADQVCHTVRQLGFSKERTLRIVDGVTRDLANNGPEWVIDRLKSLRDYYVDPESNPFPGWVKYRSRKEEIYTLDPSPRKFAVRVPKGWMGQLVSRSNVKTTIAAVMTIANACVFDSPTDKQLKKWHDSCVDPPEPHPDKEVITRILGGVKMASRLSKSLEYKLQGRNFFGPEDIHGTRIPTVYGATRVRIRRGRPYGPDLFRAWSESITSAPVSAWEQLWSLIPKATEPQARELERLRSEMRHLAPDTVRPRRKQDKRLGKKARSKKALASTRGSGVAYVGEINFLQKPGGKLRTVANPNRFVQWLMTPLGEALGDIVNSLPGVFVTDQEAGMAVVQQYLNDGVPLTSMDLSSASDTLDYSQIVDAIMESGLCSPLLANHLRYFSQLSSGVWRVSDPKARELYGDSLTWKQGQPLGLRPSFAMLTLTNWVAAAAAFITVCSEEQISPVIHRDCPPMVIVGDDIVMPSKYAEAYAEQISNLGGVMNLEKSRVSRQSLPYAEFCSRLLTPNEVVRLKPRYLVDDDPQNLLTYAGTGIVPNMPAWVREATTRCGNYSLVESGILPRWRGDQPKPLPDRFLAQVTLALKGQGLIPEDDVSLQTLFLQDQVSESPTPSSTRSKKALPPKKEMVGLVHLDVREQIDYFIRKNPGDDLVKLMTTAKWYGQDYWMKKDLQALKNRPTDFDTSLLSDERVLAISHKASLETLFSIEKQMVKDFLLLLATDPALRSQLPDVVFPVQYEVPDSALNLPHGVQKVRDHGVYDHTKDSFVPRAKSLTQLSRLDRQIRAIERDMVHDGDRSHLIAAVSDNVEMLVEDLGEGRYTVDFYSPNEQRHGLTVDATALTTAVARERKPSSGIPSIKSKQLQMHAPQSAPPEIDDDEPEF